MLAFSQRQNLVISDISWPIFITVQSVVNTAENGCTMIFCCIPVGKVAIATCLFRYTFASSALHPLSSPKCGLFNLARLFSPALPNLSIHHKRPWCKHCWQQPCCVVHGVRYRFKGRLTRCFKLRGLRHHRGFQIPIFNTKKKVSHLTLGPERKKTCEILRNHKRRIISLCSYSYI